MVISMYSYVSNKQPWRFEFFEKSIASLLKTDFPKDTHIILSDDASTDPRVKQILCDIKSPKNCRFEFIFRKTNLTCDPNMCKTMRYAFTQTNGQYVVSADTDVLYHPLWLRKLIEAKESIGGNIKIAMVTCFDTKSHPIIGTHNKYVKEKKHCGGFCAFINREIFCSKGMQTEVWDWSYSSIAQRLGYKFFCTNKSWVQHQGKGKSAGGKSWDTAHNFVGLDYREDNE